MGSFFFLPKQIIIPTSFSNATGNHGGDEQGNGACGCGGHCCKKAKRVFGKRRAKRKAAQAYQISSSSAPTFRGATGPQAKTYVHFPDNFYAGKVNYLNCCGK